MLKLSLNRAGELFAAIAEAQALYEQASATANGVILMYLTDKTHEGGLNND